MYVVAIEACHSEFSSLETWKLKESCQQSFQMWGHCTAVVFEPKPYSSKAGQANLHMGRVLGTSLFHSTQDFTSGNLCNSTCHSTSRDFLRVIQESGEFLHNPSFSSSFMASWSEDFCFLILLSFIHHDHHPQQASCSSNSVFLPCCLEDQTDTLY